jgi:hypothetical protein
MQLKRPQITSKNKKEKKREEKYRKEREKVNERKIEMESDREFLQEEHHHSDPLRSPLSLLLLA